MKNKLDQNRWQNLYYMFVAMAKGNFAYSIKRTRNDDELEALVALSNMLCEELKETFKHHGFINPRRTYLYLAKMDFCLDRNFQIINFNREVPQLLKIPASELQNSFFSELLDKKSVIEWERQLVQFQNGNFHRFSMDLTFINRRELLVAANCYISSMAIDNQRHFLTISSFTPVLFNEQMVSFHPQVQEEKNAYKAANIFSDQSDLRRVQQVRDFILQNLGKEIPNMIDLAHKFGTNESKLKSDFRGAFHRTPFQFIRLERLCLAKQLIEDTPLALKNISSTCGFKTYPHFSSAFKKEYNISPQELRERLKK